MHTKVKPKSTLHVFVSTIIGQLINIYTTVSK